MRKEDMQISLTKNVARCQRVITNERLLNIINTLLYMTSAENWETNSFVS